MTPIIYNQRDNGTSLQERQWYSIVTGDEEGWEDVGMVCVCVCVCERERERALFQNHA